MPERATTNDRSQFGIEVVPGVIVPANRQLQGTRVELDIKSESQTFAPPGSRATTTGVQNKEWAEGSITQDPAQFTDLAYLLAAALGQPTSSVPAAGAGLHEWDPLNYTSWNPKTWSIDDGSSVRAARYGYGLVTGLTMEATRSGVKVSGAMSAQRMTDAATMTVGTNEVQTITVTGTPTGGAFTVAFMGEPITVQFNAVAATIQTNLLALPNLDTGDVVVTGGPLPGTPIVVTFGGYLASTDVPMIQVVSSTLTGGSTPSVAVTQTTAGAPVTQIPPRPMSGAMWNVWAGTSLGGGLVKLPRCFGWKWSMTDLYMPFWPGNTSLDSFAGHADTKPTLTAGFTVAADATGMAYLASLRSGDPTFLRFEVIGPTIPSTALPYLFQMDVPLIVTDPGSRGETDGLHTREFGGELAYDPTSKKFASIDMRNNLATIT